MIGPDRASSHCLPTLCVKLHLVHQCFAESASLCELSTPARISMAEVKDEVCFPQPVRRTGEHPGEMLTLAEFVDPITEAGGCMQFICNHAAKVSEEVLAQSLASFFQQKADLSYSAKELLQMDDEEEHIFRLVDLGYASQATTKGPPRLHTCISLCDSMLTDGCVTQGEPLQVWKNPQTMQRACFWMSFVKGHARACTALAMAIIAMEHFPDAAALEAVGGGSLLESLKAIRVRVAIVTPDLMAVAFKNALISHRGSMRQAHDVLTWIQKLEKVSAACGTPADDVLTKWNRECPAEAKVAGNKRLCCINILKNINAECRSLLIEHVSKFGAKSAFTDDAFTSKKIFPGHKPRLSTPKWVRWGTVTNESFLLMLKHVIWKHENTHDTARCKVSKSKIERSSEMAALVVGIAQDVLESHPTLPHMDIENTFFDGFIDSDPNLLMALDSALTDADKNFDVMSLPVLNEMLLTWRKKSP